MESLLQIIEKEEGGSHVVFNPLGNLFSDSTYYVDLTSCSSPTCDCGFSVIGIRKEENLESDELDYRIALNVIEQEVHLGEESGFYAKEEGQEYLPELLSNAFTPKDWVYLKNLYRIDKFYIGENIDPQEIKFEFSPEIFEQEDGEMFALSRILPHAYFAGKFEDDFYFLHDHYCKMPDCSCTEIFMAVFILPKEREDNKLVEIGTYWYDYETKNHSIEGAEKEKTKLIFDAFLNHYDLDFDKTVERRHKIIKNLYEKAQHAHRLKKLAPKVKIGRNDPCPCGSGKKYKKCCLN